MKNRFNLVFLIFSLIIPIFIGLFVRFDDLKVWEKYRDKFYLDDGRPILTSIDGYYFARYGEEYKKGIYKAGEVDPLKFVPDNFIEIKDYDKFEITYPDPIPLESWLAGNLSKIFNKPIENIALWLTPVLAVLVVIPIVLIFRNIFNLYITGFLGALTTVISLTYISRTSVARFDTDSLNLFFPFMVVFLLLKVLEEQREKIKYIYSALAGVFLYLYYWWYFHADLIALMLLTYLFILVVSKFKNLTKSDFIAVGIIVFFANPLVVIDGLVPLINKVVNISIYSKPSDYPYPSVAVSIAELQKYYFTKLAEITIGNEVLFILGILGSVLFFVKFWKRALLILPLFLIGLMAFKNGHRFVMYLAPFIGIGLGFILDFLINFIRKQKRDFLRFSLIPVLTLLVLFVNLNSISHTELPKLNKDIVEEFINLRKMTPTNSWIWSWWDFGYPIQFYSNRGTYFDGGSQNTPKLYYVAYSYTTFSPKEAYNTIMSISSVGVKTLEYLREKKNIPVDKIVKNVKEGKYIKAISNPVYFLFTSDQLGKFNWIHYFGSWDFKKKTGKHKGIKSLTGCKNETPYILTCFKGSLKVDLKRGLIIQKRLPIDDIKKIKFVVLKDNKGYKVVNKNNEGLVLEIVINGKERKTLFLLMDEESFNTMFNKMFILRDYDKRYFELVRDNFPTAVLYRVKNINEVDKR